MTHVIELAASYRLITDTEASLTLESDQHTGVILSALHERYLYGPVCYDLATGHQQEQIGVRAGESLTLIARCQGRIIGCLVNEIDCRESSRVLLHPKGGFNLIVYQNRQHDELPLPDPQLAAFVRTLHEPTPTTTRLADLLAATVAYYDGLHVPAGLAQLLPLMEEAVQVNEEAFSRQMLTHLCTSLDTLGIHQEPQICAAFDAATRL